MELAKVAIIGVGLIGGSLGMALVQRGVAQEVVGFDPDPATRNLALQVEAVHDMASSITGACRGAEVVVLATPVGVMKQVAGEVKAAVTPGTVVTDVGSTKEDLVTWLERVFLPEIFYIGGHPMTGAEITGLKGADPYLFENAVYVVTPTEQTPPPARSKLTGLIRGVGASPLELSPSEHDQIVSAVSHLPHLAAVALVRSVAAFSRDHPQAPLLCAGGFRDTTRVAASNPVIWRDILINNREKLLAVLSYFREALQELEDIVARGDGGGLFCLLEETSAWRQQIPLKYKGLLPGIFDLVVTVPDRPGVIARLAKILADEGINIIDMEIMRVREGEGGSIRLGFQSAEIRASAQAALQRQGIRVQVS